MNVYNLKIVFTVFLSLPVLFLGGFFFVKLHNKAKNIDNQLKDKLQQAIAERESWEEFDREYKQKHPGDI